MSQPRPKAHPLIDSGYSRLANTAGVPIDNTTPLPTSVAAIVAGVTFDVSDRAARLLGVVTAPTILAQLDVALSTRASQATVAAILAQLDAALSTRASQVTLATRASEATLVALAAAIIAGVDVSDRWARQLGLVDVSRVLGALLSAANPVISGIFDAAGNRMPSMDVAARPGFTDQIDRAGRLVGRTYGSQGQQILQRAATFESVIQLNQAGAEVAAGNPLPTQGTGLHTNPRRFEVDNGFLTLPIARAGGVATAVWDVGVACISNPSGVPANGRTTGDITTVYGLEFYNPNVAAQTVWLEDGAGVVLSSVYPIIATDTIILDFDGGKKFGDNDLFVNASINAITCQIMGTEI